MQLFVDARVKIQGNKRECVDVFFAQFISLFGDFFDIGKIFLVGGEIFHEVKDLDGLSLSVFDSFFEFV